jgi:predicted ATPase
VESGPELLAHHLTEAGVIAEAITYWLLAGRRAVERSAHAEAIGHLRRGLDLVATLPESPGRDEQELSLQSTLGLPLLMTRGYAADEVELVYARARELCEKLGDTAQLYPVLWGLWAFYLVRNEFKTSTQLGDQLLFLGNQQNDDALRYEAHAAHGLNYYWQGHFATARQHFEQAVSLYDPAQHQALAVIYGQDNAGVSLGHLSNLLWIQGYPEQADTAQQRGQDVSQFHPFTFSLCLAFSAIFYGLRRDPVLCQELAERCIAITSEHGFTLWLADGMIMRGWAVAHRGDGEAGLAQLKDGIALYAAIGSLLWVTQQHAILADVHLLLGQTEEGLAAVANGLALADRTGEGLFLAELHRIRGELLLQHATPDEQGAEAEFLESLQIARSQGARSFELRTAMSLHRLLSRHGRAAESEPILREVYEWFTEGFDTPDLQEAKHLLAAVV